MSIRLVHSGVGSPFEGYSRVVLDYAGRILRALPHLCKSTPDFIQKLSKIRVTRLFGFCRGRSNGRVCSLLKRVATA